MSWIVSDFECPTHGRFAATVERVDGGPPDSIPCPSTEHQCRAYSCAACGFLRCLTCDDFLGEGPDTTILTAVRWCSACVRAEAEATGQSIRKTLEMRAARRAVRTQCGLVSPWRISGPLGRVRAGDVVRGKSDPHLPHQLDTRALADGMPKAEWDQLQKQKREDIRRQKNREMLR